MTTTATASTHIRHEVLVCGISNAIFNGLSAWLLMKNGPDLRWGGEHSFVVDIIATSLLLPFIVAIIVIPVQRGKLNKGKLQPINLGPASLMQALADRFPPTTFKSACVFGLIGMLLLAPLTLSGFLLLGIEQLQPRNYAIFKAVWTGVIAAVLVVPMVLIALRAPQQVRQNI